MARSEGDFEDPRRWVGSKDEDITARSDPLAEYQKGVLDRKMSV